MNEKLKKEELDILLKEFNEISMNVKQNDFLSGLKYLTEDLPNFFNVIFRKGFNSGYQVGKQDAINKILKSN